MFNQMVSPLVVWRPIKLFIRVAVVGSVVRHDDVVLLPVSLSRESLLLQSFENNIVVVLGLIRLLLLGGAAADSKHDAIPNSHETSFRFLGALLVLLSFAIFPFLRCFAHVPL